MSAKTNGSGHLCRYTIRVMAGAKCPKKQLRMLAPDLGRFKRHTRAGLYASVGHLGRCHKLRNIQTHCIQSWVPKQAPSCRFAKHGTADAAKLQSHGAGNSDLLALMV